MVSTVRIAMWSGPRNVSTALMRSFGSRADTIVCDEPLYAHYLLRTGLEHPGRDEILERHESDWRKVVVCLTDPLPPGKRVFFQKHMAHHLLPEIGRAWLADLTHAFLIRDPREMLPSLERVLPEPRLEDTGLPQQLRLFEEVRERSGTTPPVVDARDLLSAPEDVLRELCGTLGIPFDPAMLAWEPGRRRTDGCWAPHWYHNVERSRGFAPYVRKREPLGERLAELAGRCAPIYDELASHRLLPSG